MTDIQGLPARRAAMQLLDAVLRRGQALEAALAGATRGIENAADRALAHAIASETLRHIPDLDDLIDGATRQRLPDDAKARMVLRIALVQALVLGTPPHAAIATAPAHVRRWAASIGPWCVGHIISWKGAVTHHSSAPPQGGGSLVKGVGPWDDGGSLRGAGCTSAP